MKVTFGHWYRDSITGFVGCCTGQATYITGCDQILLARPAKDEGEEGKSLWFDKGRLVAEEGREPVKLPDHATHDTGADLQAPIK